MTETSCVPEFNGFTHEQTVSSVAQLPDGVEMHVAVVIDSDNRMITLYMNGAPQCILFQTTLKPSDLGVTPNNYLGKFFLRWTARKVLGGCPVSLLKATLMYSTCR